MMSEERTAWLEARRSGVGSSDAAAVCGLSPFTTRLEVWLDKLGRRPERKASPYLDWGHRLEPVIAAAYMDQTGRTVLPGGEMIRHPNHPWMLANLDRVTALPDQRVLELKTASAYYADDWGEPGTDEVPEGYLIQVNHQLAVTGLDVADIAVLIGGSDFRVFTVSRNERVIAHLMEIEAAFWEMVQTGVQPDPQWDHAGTPGLLAAMYEVDASMVVDLGEDAVELVKEYERLRQEEADAAGAKVFTKARLLHQMGDASLANLPDGTRLTRKTVSRKGYQVEPCEFTDFRIKAPKHERQQA